MFSTHVIPDYISDVECWEIKFRDSWRKYHKLKTERGKLFHIIYFMCQMPLFTLVCILTTWKLQRGKNLLFAPIERPRRSNADTSLVVFIILNLILQQGDNFRLCKILLSRKKRKRNSKSDSCDFLSLGVLMDFWPKCVFPYTTNIMKNLARINIHI